MKIVLISDLHFGIHNDSEIFLEHQRNFFEEQLFPYIIRDNFPSIHCRIEGNTSLFRKL